MDKPWISVKDALPLDDYSLLCMEFLDTKERFVDIGHLSEYTPKSYYKGFCPLSETRFRRVVAWMPIPDPPKGE